jgi:hypothetical protein
MSKRKKPRLYQQILVVIGGLGLVAITAPYSMAQLAEITSLTTSLFQLGGVDISQYTEYLNQAADFYSSIEDGNLQGVLDGATYALGELGYPIAGETPQAVQDKVQQVATDSSPFGFPSQHVADALDAGVDKSLSDSQAEIQLGEQGQQSIAEAKETIAQLATSANNAATTAQSLTNTQDIVKQMSLQNAYSAVLLQGIYSEILQQRINSVFDNENTAVLAYQARKEAWGQQILNQQSLPYLANIAGMGWGYGQPSNASTSQSSSLFQ